MAGDPMDGVTRIDLNASPTYTTNSFGYEAERKQPLIKISRNQRRQITKKKRVKNKRLC